MVQRAARADKILVLGVDGMDPRLTKKYVEEGKMPNVAKFIARGAQREDLVLLGGHPTVTPPMWTTLSTGSLRCDPWHHLFLPSIERTFGSNGIQLGFKIMSS